jgi:hypothetical protein
MVGIPEGAAVMTGTFSIHGKPVKILFDSGATHSFMNQSTQVNLGLSVLRVKNEFKITLVKSVPLQLGSKIFLTNLLTLGLDRIDVILGKDWMTHHKVLLDIGGLVLLISGYKMMPCCLNIFISSTISVTFLGYN